MEPNLNLFKDRIIFTNGCFDLLHWGHISFLQACKQLGGRLVVGINSDSSVKRLKGEHRPIIPELQRKQMLEALECVDEVVVFVEDNPMEIIELMQPEIYVKSDEYKNVALPEFQQVMEYGGKIAIIQATTEMKKYKTTKIVDQIFQSELERRMK